MDERFKVGQVVNYHRLHGDMVLATVRGTSAKSNRVQILVHAKDTNCAYRCSVLPTSLSVSASAVTTEKT